MQLIRYRLFSCRPLFVSPKIGLPPAVFWHFVPNGCEFIISFYTHITRSNLHKFLFNYLQLWRSYAILSETTHWIFNISLELNFYACFLSKWRHCWRHFISNMFVDIIKTADLGWLATDNDQQSYQRLLQTSERVRFGRLWTFWADYVNQVVALNMA